jgi:hypothetical protein
MLIVDNIGWKIQRHKSSIIIAQDDDSKYLHVG